MKPRPTKDNTYAFFKDVIEALDSQKKPLTKEALLNALLLSANNQPAATQHKIGNYIQSQSPSFLSQLEQASAAEEALTINKKLTTKASAIAMFYALGKVALTVVISYILPFIAFSSNYSLTMKLTIIPAASLCAFMVKGYLERSEKHSMEVLYSSVDKKWSTLTSNLESFSSMAYKYTTSSTSKASSNCPPKNENVLFNYKKKAVNQPATRHDVPTPKQKMAHVS